MNCVIGHPRSGTALIAQILNAGGQQHCRHEYLAALSSLCVPVPTRYYAGEVGDDAVQRLLEHYDEPPTPWVSIDSNWKLTWMLCPFLDRFPEARVLHLTRDPRTNVQSCHNLDFYGDLHNRPEFRARAFWMKWMPAVRRHDWDTLSPSSGTARSGRRATASPSRCERIRTTAGSGSRTSTTSECWGSCSRSSACPDPMWCDS